jgi:hypothetical protein
VRYHAHLSHKRTIHKDYFKAIASEVLFREAVLVKCGTNFGSHSLLRLVIVERVIPLQEQLEPVGYTGHVQPRHSPPYGNAIGFHVRFS